MFLLGCFGRNKKRNESYEKIEAPKTISVQFSDGSSDDLHGSNSVKIVDDKLNTRSRSKSMCITTEKDSYSFKLDYPMKRPRASTEIDTCFYDRKVFQSYITKVRSCMLSDVSIEYRARKNTLDTFKKQYISIMSLTSMLSTIKFHRNRGSDKYLPPQSNGINFDFPYTYTDIEKSMYLDSYNKRRNAGDIQNKAELKKFLKSYAVAKALSQYHFI